MTWLLRLWLVTLLALAAGSATAEVPLLVNYQGALTDLQGVPLEGTYDITFKIYTAQGAPYSAWTEIHQNVVVSGGIFNVILGEIAPLTYTVFRFPERWLGITVGSNPEIAPRTRITAVPYAYHGMVADSALAIDWVNIRSMPAGFADGVDDVGGTGDNHSLDAADGNPVDVVYVDNAGNVGVGTTTPTTKLDVRGTLNAGADGSGFDVNLYGASTGSRLLWDKTKMSLRAGRDATGLYWAPESIGTYSTAMGLNVKATDDHATAFGRDAHATGYASTALGWFAMANGDNSAVLGRLATAGAANSMVIGIGIDSSNRLENHIENSLMIGFNTTTPTLFVGGPEANVGIGMSNPEVRFEVSDGLRIQGLNYGASSYPTTGEGMEMVYRPSDNTGLIQVYDRTGQAWGKLYLGDGDVGIGTINPAEKLDVIGTVQCEVLKLTGGADIAEPFDVASGEGMGVAPGMVVAIDPDHEGRLAVADEPYDRGVAGIVSGANDVKAGLVMRQEGSTADGEHPIALTGRVYCWVDATYAAIAPGDLLTTSPTPGHAMKVTDFSRAQGAVLGKAMGSLSAGRGLVLVLVALQ